MSGEKKLSSEFRCVGGDFPITADVVEAFQQNGFIIVRGLLDAEEVSIVKAAIESDPGFPLDENTIIKADGKGRKIRAVAWKDAGSDVTGMLVRSEKVAGTMDKLLGLNTYLYHIKIISKEPFTGGEFAWHQDYGYWYHDGCLMPNLATVSIALDKNDQSNGCLKVIPGSSLLGRIQPARAGEQIGADMKRVQHIIDRQGMVPVEMEAGDAVFFHCNTLHRSDQNSSPNRRMNFLAAFNSVDNSPVYTCHGSANANTLTKVPNSAIRASKPKLDNKDFYKFQLKNSSFVRV